MILRSHKITKKVTIINKPKIHFYFLSKQEKYEKIQAFNIIIKNFKYK